MPRILHRSAEIRKEQKYLLSQASYLSLQKDFLRLLKLDPNHEGLSGYSVYSIYFDTRDFYLFSQSKNGEEVRSKFRIRFYSWDAEFCFAEIKCRDGDDSWKHRLLLRMAPRDVIEALTAGVSIQVLIFRLTHSETFINYLSQIDLEPKLFIGFQRQAFFSDELESTRITLDKGLRGCPFSELKKLDFLRENFLTNDCYAQALLELKYSKVIPLWLGQLFASRNFERVSFSKYVMVAKQLQTRRPVGVYLL